jgi:predicted kinase
MNRVIARNGDTALTRGLPPFLAMRAMILAHVRAATGLQEEAGAYLTAAQAYLSPRPAFVLAIGGLQGTGKSTLARVIAVELGRAPGALVLRSDEIRKQLHGVAPEVRLPESAYSSSANAAVDAALVEQACLVSSGGHAVVVDATFLDPGLRLTMARAVQGIGVPFLGIWLHAPLAVLEARIRSRGVDASDATVAILRNAAAKDPGALDWLAVDTRETGAALAIIRGAIAARIRHPD